MALANTKLATAIAVAAVMSACSEEASSGNVGNENGSDQVMMQTGAMSMLPAAGTAPNAVAPSPGVMAPAGALPTAPTSPPTTPPFNDGATAGTMAPTVTPMMPMAGTPAMQPGAMDMSTDGAAAAMEGMMQGMEEMAAPSGEFTLTSSVVMNEGMLPDEHRCEDDSIFGPPGMSPPLAWTAGPAGTMSYTLVLKDITPGISSGFMHWVIADIPAATMALPAAFPLGQMPADLPGAKQFPVAGHDGYLGPCARSGTNQYEFTLYAIGSASLSNATDANTAEAAAMADNLGMAKLLINSTP